MPEPTNARLFGDLLRAFREEAGLSQTELAKAAYCSQPLISCLETGTKGTREETIQAIDGAVGANGKLVLIWPVTASDQQTLENLPPWRPRRSGLKIGRTGSFLGSCRLQSTHVP